MIYHVNFAELLENSTDNADLGWTFCFIGDNPQTKLAELVTAIKGDNKDNGKQILSGFSYWGIGPTIAWSNTCYDHFYPVMQQSIQSFKPRWQQIYSNSLESRNYHYVSLGVGTGDKDYHILNSLLNREPRSFYFPVDMSSTMLRIAVQKVLNIEPLGRSQILPIQIDFSDRRRIRDLRRLIDRILPEEPVLFSLLGNTLANFQHDASLLNLLSLLLRPDDLLLLEVAITKDLSSQAVQAAAAEYSRIESFKRFVTSALLQNTDLHIDLSNVFFQPSVEEDKAILIDILYKNLTEEMTRVMLPDWSYMDFLKSDAIRLYLTRKYTSSSIERMVLSSGLSIIDRKTTDFGEEYNTRFGMDLILASRQSRINENTNSSDSSLVNQAFSNSSNNVYFFYHAGETTMTEKREIHMGSSGNYYESINTSGGNYVQGDYINMSQNLSQAAAQIQELIEQLQKNGVTVEVAQEQIAKDVAAQAQKNPTMRSKLIKWGQSLGDATVSDVVKGAVKLAIRSAGIPLP